MGDLTDRMNERMDANSAPASASDKPFDFPAFQAALRKAVAPNSDTLGEAEARRQGYAAGFDEASKRSDARIAELEAEVAAMKERIAEDLRDHEAGTVMADALCTNARRAALEEAAHEVLAIFHGKNAAFIAGRIRALAEQEPQG